MHTSVVSRHRIGSRWSTERGVPELPDLKRPSNPDLPSLSGGFEAPSNEMSDSDDTIGYNEEHNANSLIEELPTSSKRNDLTQEEQISSSTSPTAPSPSSSPSSLRSLTETDLECPLCCRLLYQPVTTRCGMFRYSYLIWS